MSKTKYYKDFWTLRHELEEAGVSQPLGDMVRCGLVEPNQYTNNHLNGRVRSDEFLNKLSIFSIFVEQANKIVKGQYSEDKLEGIIACEKWRFKSPQWKAFRNYVLHLKSILS